MVRSLLVPLSSGVATLCLMTTLWPQLTSSAAGASLFGMSGEGSLLENPIETLLQKLPLVGRISGASSVWSTTDQALQDLRVGNVSVHRVRFERDDDATETEDSPSTKSTEQEEETMIRSIFGSAWAAASRKQTKESIASVVVTWEDHPIAAELRPDDQCGADEKDQPLSCKHDTSADKDSEKAPTRGRLVLYEVQLWVNGWGFDAFWHPSNRKLSTRDPFVVLSDLPQDQELVFRVRMKVKTRTGVLSGFFATEVEGPWSEKASLTAVKQHPFEAVIVFFAANRAFGAVVALLIGISVLIILKLGLHAWFSKHKRASRPVSISTRDKVDDIFTAASGSRDRNESVDLEQEVVNLRQELADSEAEVHRLMLYRGYGIEALQAKELEDLEQELRRSLKMVQQQRRLATSGKAGMAPAFESLDETEDEDEEEAIVKTDTGRDGALQTIFEAQHCRIEG